MLFSKYFKVISKQIYWSITNAFIEQLIWLHVSANYKPS